MTTVAVRLAIAAVAVGTTTAFAVSANPLDEPFAWLHATLPGQAEPNSPDPLVATRWTASTNTSQLQIYTASPVAVTAPCAGLTKYDARRALRGRAKTSCVLNASAAVTLDFGVERAAWFEFRLAPGSDDVGLIAGLSEYQYPYTGKAIPPVAYDDGWYRLETNDELYEGLRYAWLVVPPSSKGIEVTAARCVARVRPANYTGRFHASDEVLEKMWWTGAYAARLNMNADDFGSILVDRGDRVSIQGDGHPTMAAAMAALGAPPTWALVHTMLNKTDSGCENCSVVDDGLMSYPVLWTMSCNDYFWAAGDEAAYSAFAPDMATILDEALATFLETPRVEFMGWDDRLDNGFCGFCTPETQLAFAGLLIRGAADFANALEHCSFAGAAALADHFSAAAANATSKLRSSAPAYGVHSAAYAINAPTGLVDAREAAELVDGLFQNAATVCSWSPFNSYWLLQALGNSGHGALALAHAKLCWGSALNMTRGCFPELFSPEWATFLPTGAKLPTKPSLCHPWSSGVTPWLTRVGLGLRPLDPGYREGLLAAPLLAGCAGTTDGAVATPDGPATVAARCAAGSFVVNASAPRGRVVVVALRRTLGDGCVVRRCGHRPPDRAAPRTCALMKAPRPRRRDNSAPAQVLGSATAGGAPAALLDAAEANATAAVHPLEAPGLAFVVGGDVVGKYDCGTPQPIPSYGRPVYAATVAPLDRATKGRWPGAYGADGRVFFFKNGDAAALPPYVVNVTAYGNDAPARTAYAANDTLDAEALLCVDAECSSRALGSLGEGCDDGCQGTVLDVALSDAPASLRVTLYFVDVPGSDDANAVAGVPYPTPDGRAASVLRAEDLATGALVAPEAATHVTNFTAGAYLSLSYSSSLRLRLMPVFGSARVSAVLFDS